MEKMYFFFSVHALERFTFIPDSLFLDAPSFPPNDFDPKKKETKNVLNEKKKTKKISREDVPREVISSGRESKDIW